MSAAESSRFQAPTNSLDLQGKLRALRRLFWFSLAVAAVAHLAVVGINPFQRSLEKTPRPLTTRFIKREPRLTKPLELRKRPQPKRQMIRRQVQLAAARMDQVQATATFNTRGLINRVAAPSVSMSRQVDFQTMDLEPVLAASVVSGARQPENKVDMALEMLDVNSMDTGQYRAMVVQDPNDRQALKGFVNFALVMSARSVASGTVGYASINVKAVDSLVDAVNEYTGLQARFIGQITYDDNRLMDVPVVVPQGVPNESEMENLARYLEAGGFFLGGVPEFGQVLQKYGGMTNGQDFWTARLTDDHPVFSAFFDIKGGGALSGLHEGSLGNQKAGVNAWALINGQFIRGRLVGVGFSHGTGWLNHEYDGDGTRNLMLAVNMIVYGLTQEGSITQRLMQMVD